ncbi:MAG: hypothetical protein M3O68_03280, partial [Thermoproteota archaeon]|nr:hypothetical protein [Thermoproteota archaeon]
PSAGILHVLEQSSSVVINILLYKYQMFLEMNINEIGKKIIQRIIIDLISTVLECFQVTDLNKNNDINSIRDHNCKLVMDHTIPVMSHGGFMYQYVNEGVTQVLDSMFSIVDPRKEFIKRSINYRLESTNDIVASTIPDRDEAEFYFRQSILSAIPFYKKIVAKFT